MVKMRARISGFTLIELSIVLVVIGLVVAGVVSGSSIIRAAKVNAQIAQFKKFEVAYNGFRLAYDAIPGDMSNASSYWSAATNGNGNRQIEDLEGYNCAGACGQANNGGEKITFFHHLYLAGLVPEVYTGTGYGSIQNIGNAVPPVFFKPSDFYLIAASRYYSSVSFGQDIVNPNAPTVGVYLFAGGNDSGTLPFNPPDLAAIDRKMDDGYPTSGRLWGIWESACSTSSTTPTSYLTTNTRAAHSGCGAQYVLSK